MERPAVWQIELRLATLFLILNAPFLVNSGLPFLVMALNRGLSVPETARFPYRH